ncbi:DUF397 domain-containing protein [Streptomyces tsukubensis]|uniref:DUF397 domain-containing protein n=1 Tax=Streptomyces tsukubensis TaxID=83656 RepID=A0A1V4A371_9ACTN|nr:DUF397 domain-containing protein [Streptomyces tsukubensis]OON74408.1 DUF397 domain-containing protein [Streptomyces tsukubensis]QFR95353.1 DUF397 domain-containing protein [Streptomyces tsukubensis]
MTAESLHWFKSSYSANGGQCVEVAATLIASHGVVPVRDSKVQCGPVLAVGVSAFDGFVAGVKGGTFGAL